MVCPHILEGAGRGGSGSWPSAPACRIGLQLEELLLGKFAASDEPGRSLLRTGPQNPGVLHHLHVRRGAPVGIVRAGCHLERDLDAMQSERTAEHQFFVQPAAADDCGTTARGTETTFAADWRPALNLDTHRLVRGCTASAISRKLRFLNLRPTLALGRCSFCESAICTERRKSPSTARHSVTGCRRATTFVSTKGPLSVLRPPFPAARPASSGNLPACCQRTRPVARRSSPCFRLWRSRRRSLACEWWTHREAWRRRSR